MHPQTPTAKIVRESWIDTEWNTDIYMRLAHVLKFWEHLDTICSGGIFCHTAPVGKSINT